MLTVKSHCRQWACMEALGWHSIYSFPLCQSAMLPVSGVTEREIVIAHAPFPTEMPTLSPSCSHTAYVRPENQRFHPSTPYPYPGVYSHNTNERESCNGCFSYEVYKQQLRGPLKRSVLTFTYDQLGHWSTITLTAKQGYYVWHFLYLHLCRSPLALALATTDKRMAFSSLIHLSTLQHPQASLPPANQPQLSQPVLV